MDVDQKTISRIEQYLKSGIKLFFFTYDPTDLIYENSLCKKAIENQMLFVYEIRFNESIVNDFIFFDGQIPSDVLNLLSSSAPYFNKEQYLIEHSPLKENILVSAGAGTGKTTVMINRIFFLKYKDPNLSFSQIGLITFTNKAALNMKEKLVQKLKTYFDLTKDLKYLKWMQEIKHMTIGTIHFFAEKILQHNKEILQLPQEIRISEFNYKREKIIEKVIDDFHYQHPDIYRKFKYIEHYKIIHSVEMIIDQLMNHSIALEELEQMNFGNAADDSHILFDYVVKETCRRLMEYKQSVNYMDVNDLMIMMGRMIRKNAEYHIPFQYVIVDEFQDTDKIQTKFFAYLASRFSVNLFVVGDVKQSIYRFRGADYTAFTQLKELTTIHRTYYLQKNYRTDRPLLTKLNNIFSVWPRYVENFRFQEGDFLLNGFEPKSPAEKPFEIKRFQSKPGMVKFLRENEETDTAVLVRSNREVHELSKLCEDNQIFYISEQDGDFYRSIPVREFYMLVRRFTHPNDWRNRYTLHLSSYGERSIKVQYLIDHFSPDKSLRSFLSNADPIFEEYAGLFNKRPVFEVLGKLIEYINPAKVYSERYVAKKEDEKIRVQGKILYKEYQMNLEHLLFLLKREMFQQVPSLFRLERILRLKMTTDKTISKLYIRDKDSKRLSIMTVHKAKGLEFDQIFLPNTGGSFYNSLKTDVIINGKNIGYKALISEGKTFENDNYRKFLQTERIENIGEEARLLYVALTRAKKAVVVDAPEQTNNATVKNWGDLIARGISQGAFRQAVFSS